jgi:hypothetical protein
MISLEQYAELCALMADTGGDVAREHAIAAQHGVDAAAWDAAKAGYTARMSDPNDMGRTAMAFMPLYQAAQARARGGAEPCTLEVFARVHAEMAFRKGPDGEKIDYHQVLAEHGYTHQSWLECEGYWTPRLISDTDPNFDPAAAARFRVLMQEESDRIFGIVR